VRRTAYEDLRARGLTRREFLRLCATLAALAAPRLSLAGERNARSHRGAALANDLARAMQTKPRLPVLWLAFQDCAGCTEALLRSQDPMVSAMLASTLSLEYHETLAAATGAALEEHRSAVMQRFADSYLLVVEGSVPDADNAATCVIGGRSAVDHLDEVAGQCAAALLAGNCAAFGGVAAASPNPTGARPASSLVAGHPTVAVPGCPAIPEVTAAVLLHYFAYDEFPPTDELLRPVTEYRQSVHASCDRRVHYLAGEFAESFDDEGARAGWCLRKLGCRGPETMNACAVRGWGLGLSFPVESGHPCIGCSEPAFWDASPIYPWQPRRHAAHLPIAVDGASP
jgi:hydrogenase small subunit